MTQKKTRVLVGMSGGVDSAVAALLLRTQGYEVQGVFLHTWTPPHLPCPQDEDRLHAIENAVALGIPFATIDTGNAYYEKVFLPMVAAYREGLTPNPDVWCNQSVKFLFLAEAAEERAALFATGHYARRSDSPDGEPLLSIPKDTRKDQTYFLSSVPRSLLRNAMFPLADLTKDEVRRIAREHNLPAANRRDSVGICFLGALPLKDLLAPYLPLEPGPVVNLKGEVIGRHEGLPLYTIGQRHGFTVAPQSPSAPAWYVVAKIPERNMLVVHTDRSVTAVTTLCTKDWNWLVPPQKGEMNVFVRYRHGQHLQEARLRVSEEGQGSVLFAQAQVAVAPGQWLAAYRADGVVIGGGTIAPYRYPALEYMYEQ